jgi:hypothetical protein
MDRSHVATLAYAADVVGNLTTIPELSGKGLAGHRLYVESGSPITTVTFYDAPFHSSDNKGVQYGSPAGTFLAAQDSTGAQIALTVVAGKSYPFPTDLFAAGAIKIVVNSAGNLKISSSS